MSIPVGSAAQAVPEPDRQAPGRSNVGGQPDRNQPGGGARLARRAGVWRARVGATAAIAIGAVLLRAVTGVGFANYDTLYALVWGQQMARGESPQYAIPIAPTPHPLMEAVGVPLGLLGARTASDATVWLAYLALATCGYLLYRLTSNWFNRPAGAVAALVFLTRTPILSYGSRAYVDVPFVALMLGAMLIESRRRRAGAPVLALLALAGLLRPEAWVFSGLYWLYLAAEGRLQVEHRSGALPRVVRTSSAAGARTLADLTALALLAVLGFAIWVLSDLAVTGNAMWSLSHTRQTAETLDRQTGLAKVPEYVPRRIGEVMGIAGVTAALAGLALALAWLRSRARMGFVVGIVAVAVLATLAGFGLPIDERYAFLTSAVACAFAGAGVFGWLSLAATDRHRHKWRLAAGVVALVLVASAPGQYHRANTQLKNLRVQQQIQNELVALVQTGQITRGCEPFGVPNHAPIPLLALWLKVRPGLVVSAAVASISHGTYVQAANATVRNEYILDPHEPARIIPHVPAGFAPSAANRSWVVYKRCL